MGNNIETGKLLSLALVYIASNNLATKIINSFENHL
jgi:hypothetical protein